MPRLGRTIIAAILGVFVYYEPTHGAEFNPTFPIPGLNPFTFFIINSVSDQSLGLGAYTENGIVRAYTGETGELRFPGGHDDCYSMDAAGTSFVLDGNYRGAFGRVLLCYDGHPGVDFKVDSGTQVVAAEAGVVIALRSDRSDAPDLSCSCLGNFVKIDHRNGFVSIYGHLLKNSLVKGSRELRIGDEVSSGELIALSGNSGVSSGPHLHFELQRNGAIVDPYTLWASRTRFDFALDSLRVDGNIAQSFVDEFDDGLLTAPPTSFLDCRQFSDDFVAESSGYLRLRSDDSAHRSIDLGTGTAFLVDSCILGLPPGSPYRLREGFGNATVKATFRADVPLPGQEYGIFISTTAPDEGVSIRVGNQGTGPVAIGIAFPSRAATAIPMSFGGAQRIILRLELDDANRVRPSFSTNGGVSFTEVPLPQPGMVFVGGAEAIVSVFGSVVIPP